MSREYTKVEREALITKVLSAGPMTVTGIARQVLGVTTTTEKVPRSFIARITQSLRVMERDGIVARTKHANGTADWRLQ